MGIKQIIPQKHYYLGLTIKPGIPTGPGKPL